MSKKIDIILDIMALRLENLKKMQMTEDRCIDLYWESLGKLFLTEGDLRGKKILDIGSGVGRFGYCIRRRGIPCNIVELDRRYITTGQMPAKGAIALGGDGLQLPFSDNVFDVVISSGCIPILLAGYAKYDGEEKVISKTRQSLDEVCRVTRPGGFARMNEIPRSEDIGLGYYDHEVIGQLAVISAVDGYIQNLNSTEKYQAKVKDRTLFIDKK